MRRLEWSTLLMRGRATLTRQVLMRCSYLMKHEGLTFEQESADELLHCECSSSYQVAVEIVRRDVRYNDVIIRVRRQVGKARRRYSETSLVGRR